MTTNTSRTHIERIRGEAEKWSAEVVLRWAFQAFEGRIEIASAFGAEGLVVIDLAARIRPDFKLFVLNTGYLFTETLQLAKDVERRYGISIEHVFSEITPEAQARAHEPALWRKNPDLCCHIRKVEPLKKKLAGLSAWVTAIRREQTPVREHAGKVEWDSKFDLVKINPIADWTHQMVWNYIDRHKLAYNPLHDQGYPSIGCIHCTHPVNRGEHARSGRWRGFSKIECGLHEPRHPQE